NLFQAKSADETIAKVTATVGVIGTVEIQGVNAGVVGVVSGTKNGLVFADMYQITDSRNISAYTLKDAGQVMLAKAGDTAQAPVTIMPSSGKITWKSLNSAVASVNSTGNITGVSEGAAIIVGEFTDKWGVDRDLHIIAFVGAGSGSISGDGDLILGGDGNWYKPVGAPPNVYEKVNEDGSSLTPPEYVYNPDGQPGNGNNKPVGKFGSEYWVNMGQNVWRKVEGPYTLGPLTGGGPNMNPATGPVTPIYENNGKYYVGPLGSSGSEYYYGDPAGGNGTLDSTASSTEKDDVIYYKDDNGNMIQKQPAVVTSVIIVDSVETADIGKSYHFTAVVNGNSEASPDVIWEVLHNTSEGTSIGDDGTLYVAYDENATLIVVSATAVSDPSKTDSVFVRINKVNIPGLPDGKWDSSQVGKTIHVDRMDWTIIKADGNGNLLIVSAYPVVKCIPFGSKKDNNYETSYLKTVMDGFYTKNQWPTLFSCVKGADIPCEDSKNDNLNSTNAPSKVNEASSTFVFALSVSDLNTSYFSTMKNRRSSYGSWLRTAGNLNTNACYIMADGCIWGFATDNCTGAARPAMWIGK
ncbi:MAG: Ig-like domain-containing protein, partial [Clostridiales bacterium]|nr:Ig-like domain-containing protein [Clostridiales bacterium]